MSTRWFRRTGRCAAGRGRRRRRAAGALPTGAGAVVVPLRYVSAAEMKEVLQPFASPGAVVRVDTARNLLVLSGTQGEIESLLEVIATFDVDWLGGMSFAVLPVQTADPETVVAELEEVFGNPETGPLAGVVRFVPIARLSAILVISARPVYLERARQWIERLDYGDEQVARIFVYYCENSRASDLGEVLNEIFQPGAAAGRRELAPGLTPTQIGGRRSGGAGGSCRPSRRGGAGGDRHGGTRPGRLGPGRPGPGDDRHSGRAARGRPARGPAGQGPGEGETATGRQRGAATGVGGRTAAGSGSGTGGLASPFAGDGGRGGQPRGGADPHHRRRRQERAGHPGDAEGLPAGRGGAEEARHHAVAGADRGDDPRGGAERRAALRRRVVLQVRQQRDRVFRRARWRLGR